jgi:Tfp pilus assembly protein PilX
MPATKLLRRTTRIARNERGVALVATLLVLVALTALVAILAMRTMSEKNVTLNHRVANRSMYAADSGTEAAMQQITAYADLLDSMAFVWRQRRHHPAAAQPVPAGGLSTTCPTVNHGQHRRRSRTARCSCRARPSLPLRRPPPPAPTRAATRDHHKGRLRVSATRGSLRTT